MELLFSGTVKQGKFLADDPAKYRAGWPVSRGAA